MLTELCHELRNWFEREKIFGEFTISDGQLNTTGLDLQDGQYFRIIGSVFNDGVHKYEPTAEQPEQLTDEVFEGAIWLMAVPPAIIALSQEIQSWVDKYGEAVNSPYSSESFGGYSYTKASAGKGNNNSSPSWRSAFASELGKWRKL